MLNTYIKVLVSLILSSFIMVTININVFNIKPYIYDEFVYLKSYPKLSPGFYSKELIHLTQLSKQLELNSLIAVVEPECFNDEEAKNFIYSAYLEARIWNECHMYNSKYKGGQFYLVSLFKNTDYSKKEDPDQRYKIVQTFALNTKISKNECIDLILKYKWTHILMNKDNIDRTGNCLKNSKFYEQGNYLLFKI